MGNNNAAVDMETWQLVSYRAVKRW